MHENHDLLLKYGLSYDKKNNTFFDIKTGEVVNIHDRFNNEKKVYEDSEGSIYLSNDELNRIMQKDFEDYNSPLQNYENDFLRESRDTFNEEYNNHEYGNIINSFENDLSHKPISNSGKYNFLKSHPEFLSDDWVVSDKGIAINKNTGEVIDM